jgi:general secretion pathway protein H
MALAIAGLAAALAVVSVDALTSASLRSTSVELAGAMKHSYDRAIMEKRLQRIGFDIDRGLWWLEYTEDPFSLAAERATGEKGASADPEDDRERGRAFDDLEDEDTEVREALEGGKAAAFRPDGESGEPRRLPGGVSFARVWTGHQEEPFTSGVAYLHFFRGGFTEPALIELTDGDDVVTLDVSPLTGRVRTRDGQMEAPRVEEDDGRAEGDE